jgi:hypothetical protein
VDWFGSDPWVLQQEQTRRLTGHNIFSASNKGHGQVSHVEARVEFEVEPIHNPLTCLQTL